MRAIVEQRDFLFAESAFGRSQMKKTRIVATISDLNCSEEFIRSLGMNVVRLNSAHQSLAGALKIVNSVRVVSERIALMMDTKGPEIRTGSFSEPFPVATGQIAGLGGFFLTVQLAFLKSI